MEIMLWQKHTSINFWTIDQIVCEAPPNEQICPMLPWKFQQMIPISIQIVSKNAIDNYVNVLSFILPERATLEMLSLALHVSLLLFLFLFRCVCACHYFSLSFVADQINEASSRWGDTDTCLIYYYFPVVEITATIFWIVFILISRREDERSAFKYIVYLFHTLNIGTNFASFFLTDISFFVSFCWSRTIHKAWRLVVPAVICFAVLAICCVIYAAYLNSRLNGFCDEFKQKFSNHEIPCDFHINRFSIKDTTVLAPATNFNMAKSVSYARIFLWLLGGFVMLLRCILGADFEMHEIENCTERVGAAFDPETDLPSRVKFIDDSIKRYSRERVYNPTTTELQRLD